MCLRHCDVVVVRYVSKVAMYTAKESGIVESDYASCEDGIIEHGGL